jgi:hypothetical protein
MDGSTMPSSTHSITTMNRANRMHSGLVRLAALAGLLLGTACDPEDTSDAEQNQLAAPEVREELGVIVEVDQGGADESGDPAPREATFDELISIDLPDVYREPKITVCNCGNGIYVGVECAGYPGTDVCCGEKCSELLPLI